MAHPFVDYLIERDLIPPEVGKQLIEKHHRAREPVGMIAVSHCLLNANQIDVILDRQSDSDLRFGEIAVELGYLTKQQVSTLVKIQEFRTSAGIAESLALAGILSCEDTGRYLGAFLVSDNEVMAMMSDE